MSHQRVIILANLLVLAAIGCSDDPITPKPQNQLTGQVLDADGTPVEGVGILMNFALPKQNRPTTQIEYSLPEETHVTVFITSDCYQGSIRTLVDEVLPAGNHYVMWDAHDDEGLIVPSGLYVTNISQNNDLQTHDLVLFHSDFGPEANPEDYRLQAVTAADGTFSLTQDCLPFGHTMDHYDEEGNVIGTTEISREVRFFALHRDFPTAVSQWTVALESSGCQVEIQFPVP